MTERDSSRLFLLRDRRAWRVAGSVGMLGDSTGKMLIVKLSRVPTGPGEGRNIEVTTPIVDRLLGETVDGISPELF